MIEENKNMNILNKNPAIDKKYIRKEEGSHGLTRNEVSEYFYT